jgi:hypothetical protein
MSFRDAEDRRLWDELAQMDAADTSQPVPLPEDDGAAGPLRADQIAFFKEHGYLLLRNFLGDETVARWREAFAGHIGGTVPGFDLADDATWPSGADGFASAQAGWSFPVTAHPKFARLVNQLGGGRLVENRHTSNNAARWPAVGDAPNDPAAWRGPAAGHIDGSGPGGWSGGFSLGITTMLSDVRHAGGAFTIWPRSHRAVHRYFLAHPEQIDGSFYNLEQFSWDALYKSARWSEGLDVPEHGLEVIADAGDVCLWHNFLCHDGSPVLHRNEPRLAIISRFHMVDMFRGPQMCGPGEDGRVEPPNFEPLDSRLRQEEPRYYTPQNLWEKWSEETQQATYSHGGSGSGGSRL